MSIHGMTANDTDHPRGLPFFGNQLVLLHQGQTYAGQLGLGTDELPALNNNNFYLSPDPPLWLANNIAPELTAERLVPIPQNCPPSNIWDGKLFRCISEHQARLDDDPALHAGHDPDVQILLGGHYSSRLATADSLTLFLTPPISQWNFKLPEKLAIFWLNYIHLKYRISPSEENFKALPPWFHPRPSQCRVTHPIFIDTLPWPQLREKLTLEHHAYPFNVFTPSFCSCLNVNWPYDPAATYVRQDDDATGAVHLSPAFKMHLHKLENWSLKPAFAESFPELRIGRATARLFAKEGCRRIAIADVQAAALKKTREELEAEHKGVEVIDIPTVQLVNANAVRADVTSESSVTSLIKSTVDRFGRVDYACNVAGILLPGVTTEYSVSQWDKQFSVNTRGMWLCQRAEITQMLKQEPLRASDTTFPARGSIANVASMAGLRVYDNLPAYCASKHAVVGFTKADGLHFARDGIRVNAICPGVIKTPMLGEVPEEDDTNLEEMVREMAMKRQGLPEEIAEALVWITSGRASFVTATTLAPNGGEQALSRPNRSI
ncbi:hypothetical protein AYO20_01317 [Fonsecaea nubica]|uniref:Uncharacterized protein n=1 Tax=Fonsecaea nubica TaxID=856822 RepID=A0A178DCR8_9EURO|nr:hypothetical protein AYO20_01317 [Fonsecaea nubica]OAL39447.1 hypothetical protein AYO20_01317 [Fonsecaea nubica]